MRIGLLAVDSRIPNLALMKLSTWHKAQGDTVEIASPLWGEYDRVYRSKQFDFTPDDAAPWGCEVVSGGTGYDLTTTLPCDDTTRPDYNLFGCDYAMGYTTRGCPRRCPFCVVWRKDGDIHRVADPEDFWSGQTRLRLMDDNLLAAPFAFEWFCNWAVANRVKIAWENLDARLLTDEAAAMLMRVPRWGNLHFAWDNPHDDTPLEGLRTLKRYYPSLHDVLVYVLVGYNTTPEEDLYRVEALRALGAMPFVMPYRKDEYTRRFARWVNQKAVFRSTSWADYRLGMGHGKAAIR